MSADPGQVPRPRRLGPVMLDLEGAELSAEERELLRHPAVGGVILFRRNFVTPEQLVALTDAIIRVDERRLLIAVDQEGGRVQRFSEGLTRLPSASRFGVLYARDPRSALEAARAVGWLMAAELRQLGVDFSFAPVLDVEQGLSHVIGDRAFAMAPEAVASLATAWLQGVHSAGMAGCGKHFPGHGGVVADSHLELPEDHRPLSVLEHWDLLPFRRLIAEGLEAIMPAHVRYAAIDPDPAGFSAFWLREQLRGRLRFGGAIISDDLNMAGAGIAGSPAARALAALQAGCDLTLICNNREAAIAVVEAVVDWPMTQSAARLQRLRARTGFDLGNVERRLAALTAIDRLPA
ncbi:beta-N-acetylhexosaminidase [Lamprobacter sp.]|uniref:beta-N-acetylhexosaminidase n=1 Tax=Lamprobacter sp. TaxID=3100796 RepID=UPI003A4D9433